MKKIFYVTIFSLIFTTDIHTLLVTGDPEAAAGETFSFDVGFAAFDSGSDLSGPRLWVANNDAGMAGKADTVKPYGLSFIYQLASYVPSTTFPSATPMTNQEAATVYTFDGTTASVTSVDPNPIWGATFQLFNVGAQYPTFVLAGSLNSIYQVQDIEHYTTPTTEKPNVTKLIRYDFAVGEQVAAILAYGKTAIFAAHATGGAFGTNPSKITELSAVTQNGIPYFGLTADTTIDTTTTALSGGSGNLATLSELVTLNFMFNTFYISLDVTANAAPNSCGTALTFATLIPSGSIYDFVFQQVAPASVLTTGIDTAISAAAGNKVRIPNTAGMLTSTNLQYIIISRDEKTPPGDLNHQQYIYALPVVTTGSNAGQIADFSSIVNTFNPYQPFLAKSREFNTVVSSVTDIDPAGIYAAQLIVGAGAPPLLATNSIQQLYTVGDCVYVVIGDDYAAGQTPGTFQSQAIFAQDGHIIAWTPWKRVLGSDKTMNYSFVDRKTISGYYIDHVTTNFRAVNQTTFVYDSNLAPVLTTPPTAGIQGIFNFPASTSGLNVNHISLLIATGYEQIVIGQTGIANGTNVAINSPVTTESFTDDALKTNALIACEIAHNGTNHWIFVGGSTGVSVLTGDNTGYTWQNNLANVAALNAGQTFKKVGNFTFVKKLVWDSTYLYVLTSTGLYRILLDPNKFLAAPTTSLNAELIASSTTIAKNTTYFLDLIVDSGYCVLGTTNGLYAFGDGGLQKISIPNGLPAASQLIAISGSNEPQRNFKTLSNLIVLNNSFGTQQARINRFVITDGEIAPFDDCLIAEPNTTNGIPSSFIKFDNYISNYFTDSSWNLASSYYLGVNQPSNTKAPSVLQLFTGIHSGFSSSQMIFPYFSNYAPLSFINGVNLAGFIRESTSGSLITYGSFPSHVNA